MLENRKGYVMASNTKSKKARGRQEHRLTKKQKRIRRRRKLIGILAAELVLLLVLGAGVWAISKLDKIQDLNVAPSDVAMNDMEDATGKYWRAIRI